ncbi:MAG: Na+/H+ antiporter subunit E [Wenzhouxiangella sp.]|nr:Na+/H+ antiporter subunit E [Wenzhouxiangella sp.]
MADSAANNAITPATRKQRWTWAVQIFVVLLLLWLLLNGLDRFLAGLLAAAAGAGLGAWLVSGQPHPWKPHRLIWFAGFFLWESFKGGVDVAWRAMHPGLKINPCFSSHCIDLPTGQPRTLMVATVSLLPGTLSADLSEDGRDLEIHALMPEAMASVERLEAWVAWLFSIES